MKLTVLLLLSLVFCYAHASEGWTNCTSLFPLYSSLPFEPTPSVRICRESYLAISYDVDMINPAISIYHITPADVKNPITGRDNFYEDPDLKALGIAQAAVDSDAFNTTWNRGHLAPNHIMSSNDVSKKSCATMANIAPQEAYFNQHPWNYLEQDIFDWILANSTLYLITGVAYKDRAHARRTFDGISVPDYYFTVLCDKVSKQSAGFLGDNNVDGKISYFVPVTDVEKVYGGLLFPATECATSSVTPSHWWAL